MKRCVIFDIEGVIIDTGPFHKASEKMIFKLMGIPVSDKELSESFGCTDEEIWTEIGKSYELPITVPEIIRLKETLFLGQIKSEVCLRSIANITELIWELCEYDFTLAVASPYSSESISYILDSLSLKKYFQCVIGGCNSKNSKLNPEIFLKVSNSTGIAAESCIVIEHTVNGIKTAKNANMKCIAYNGKQTISQDYREADLIISSFNEISAESIGEILCRPVVKTEKNSHTSF